MSVSKIEISSTAVKSALVKLDKGLKDFEEALLDLFKVASFAKDELTGQAYSAMFEAVYSLIDQQKEILVFEQLVVEEIEAFFNEMLEVEQSCAKNFAV